MRKDTQVLAWVAGALAGVSVLCIYGSCKIMRETDNLTTSIKEFEVRRKAELDAMFMRRKRIDKFLREADPDKAKEIRDDANKANKIVEFRKEA